MVIIVYDSIVDGSRKHLFMKKDLNSPMPQIASDSTGCCIEVPIFPALLFGVAICNRTHHKFLTVHGLDGTISIYIIVNTLI